MSMTNAVVELGRTPHWIVEHDVSRSFLRFRRNTVPFASKEEILAQFVDAVRILAAVDRSTLGLLLDMRDGPMRNDDVYEEALGGRETRFFAGFARFAALVRTQVGKLQVIRRTRGAGVDRAVFTDEAEAIAAVTLRPPSSR